MIKLFHSSLKNKPPILIAIIVAVVCLVAAIIILKLEQNKYIDRSIITTTPCAVPCWQNITPGVTTSIKALEYISKSIYVKKDSLRLAGTNNTGGCTWSWRYSGRRMQPSMVWENGIVETIRMGLTFDLTVQEVIGNWGFPELVEAIEGGQPEHWYWVVNLYYPTQGVQFVAYTPEFNANIATSTEVGSIVLFPPSSFNEWIKQKDLEQGSSVLYYTYWKGYGNIPDLYTNARQWP